MRTLSMRQTALRFSKPWSPTEMVRQGPAPAYKTAFGAVYNQDCCEFLERVPDGVVDTVFADPPFNIGKHYGRKVDDLRGEATYLEWCRRWLDHCVRVLKPGGALFVYNLPKWNIHLGAHLSDRKMVFRHWVAVNIKASLPIAGRLYPSHYSLLYLTKGKPKTFRRIRTPIETCRHCGGEIKDYGGHRHAMNPKGVNLTDVWNDVPPVRHWKFKSRRRGANQLSTKLVSRAIELSSRVGDLVLDPFGGSGTTFDICERTGRHWLGSELESCDVIVERLEGQGLSAHPCEDYVEPND
jgi:site-specific DNA-methyltransferase (adenine-specific)